MGAFTLDQWNEIIRQINDLAENPPNGCESVDTLEEVEAPHKWSKDDIQQVQDKLTEICKDNNFSDIPDLWKQDTIDEINDAISQGWCDCNNCDCSNAKGIVETYCGAIEQTDCTEDTSNCPGACQAATSAAGQAALQKMYQWADAWLAYCATRTKEALDLANSYEQEAEAKAQESLDQANQCSPIGMVLSFTSLLAPTPGPTPSVKNPTPHAASETQEVAKHGGRLPRAPRTTVPSETIKTHIGRRLWREPILDPAHRSSCRYRAVVASGIMGVFPMAVAPPDVMGTRKPSR